MRILAAAFELFEEDPTALAQVAAVAERAGLAKGTVYLYFESREAIFVSLLEDQLHAWMARFEEALPSPLPADRAALAVAAPAAFCEVPLARRSLLRLAGLAHALLERNIDAA